MPLMFRTGCYIGHRFFSVFHIYFSVFHIFKQSRNVEIEWILSCSLHTDSMDRLWYWKVIYKVTKSLHHILNSHAQWYNGTRDTGLNWLKHLASLRKRERSQKKALASKLIVSFQPFCFSLRERHHVMWRWNSESHTHTHTHTHTPSLCFINTLVTIRAPHSLYE